MASIPAFQAGGEGSSPLYCSTNKSRQDGRKSLSLVLPKSSFGAHGKRSIAMITALVVDLFDFN